MASNKVDHEAFLGSGRLGLQGFRGFRGFRGLGIWGIGFRGFGCRVSGLGAVLGLEFRVSGPENRLRA